MNFVILDLKKNNQIFFTPFFIHRTYGILCNSRHTKPYLIATCIFTDIDFMIPLIFV